MVRSVLASQLGEGLNNGGVMIFYSPERDEMILVLPEFINLTLGFNVMLADGSKITEDIMRSVSWHYVGPI